MKYGWLISLAMTGAALCVGGCDTDFDFSKVDNPEYAAWKGFPAGSEIAFEGMKQTGAENPRRIRITESLLVFDRAQAIIKRRTQVFNPGGPGELEFTDVTIPARIKKNACLLTQDGVSDNFRGWDSVMVGDQLYDCEVHYYVVKHDGEMLGVKTLGETGVKIWQCKQIPGGIAKIEITGLSPSHLFSLSGQVVDVASSPVTVTPPPAPSAEPATGPTTEPTTIEPIVPAKDDSRSDLENAVTSPDHLPITPTPAMPTPERKMQTSGLKTSTSQPSEDEEPAPKVILPVTNPAETVPQRKPDPKPLSEEDEYTPVEPSVTPVKLDVPEKIENDIEPLPRMAAPSGSR